MKQIIPWLWLLVLFPIVVLTISNPIKILLPQLAGVKCVETWLCVEDLAQADKARQLYLRALGRVENKLSAFQNKPLLVFCTSQSCFSSFGFKNEAGQSIGSMGAVIAPRGWLLHFVEHELIHQWQAQQFGVAATWAAPRWLSEGMAYSMSGDPRHQLVAPYQGYREIFEAKFSHLSKDVLLLMLRASF
ncbi:MAG: hypothetical protein OEW58_02355 [Gammaproteobacteria bacterium]|nr:hypothetical protein [Gammaproteobacteria bacterium]